jgi:hypothetical protein
MLAEAVGHHVASFPAGAREYYSVVEILDQLRATAAMTAIDAGLAAAKLVAGKVAGKQLDRLKDSLTACPEGQVDAQRFIFNCL